MEKDVIFQKDGKSENVHEGWKIIKCSCRMENRKMFLKDGKLINVPEGWKIEEYS